MTSLSHLSRVTAQPSAARRVCVYMYVQVTHVVCCSNGDKPHLTINQLIEFLNEVRSIARSRRRVAHLLRTCLLTSRRVTCALSVSRNNATRDSTRSCFRSSTRSACARSSIRTTQTTRTKRRVRRLVCVTHVTSISHHTPPLRRDVQHSTAPYSACVRLRLRWNEREIPAEV